MRNYVITIARGFGSGGKDIGTRLSKELNIPCYERQLLTMASDKSNIDESIFVETDEKLRGSYITNVLRKIPFPAAVEATEKDFVSDTNVFRIQANLIRELAKTESCIIIGKCADYILRDYDNVISVYVEAPREACIKSIMEKMHVCRKRAIYLIKSTDKYRAKYYNFYTNGRKWTDPMNYDLVINTERMGRENTVKLIKDLVKIRYSD